MIDLSKITNDTITAPHHAINPKDNKKISKSNIWYNLDVNNKSHFSNDQCFIAVSFSGSLSDQGYKIQQTLPVYPEDISFSTSTNYADATMIGRPGSISGYVNTDDKTINFSLHLHRELLVPGELTSDKNKIDCIVTLIEACQYPKRTTNGLYIPIVTYKFGDTEIVGKQTSCNIKWGGPKINNKYMECNIDISVTYVPKGINYFDSFVTINEEDKVVTDFRNPRLCD